MAKDSVGRQQLRQLIAQQAARLMADEGIGDFAYAKRKAGRQLGVADANCFPSNSEIEDEIRLHHQIYHQEEQSENLQQLRIDALAAMQLLERFNPHLTGPVLEGTAGRYAETDIQLFADSSKEVEIFLLNNQIPYSMREKTYRISNDRKNQEKSGERKKVPIFLLEGPNGLIKLSVFTPEDMRTPTKNPANGENSNRVNAQTLQALISASEKSLNP